MGSGYLLRNSWNPYVVTQPLNTDFFLLFPGVGNAFQPPPSTMNPGNTGSNPPAGPNYTSQLATMREVGIMDERLATRALEVMGGDVQAAIDLIYSGWDDSQ